MVHYSSPVLRHHLLTVPDKSPSVHLLKPPLFPSIILCTLNTAIFSLVFSLCHAYNFLTQRSAPLFLNSQITFFTHSSPQTSLQEAPQQAQNDQNWTEFTFSFAYFLLRTPQSFWLSACFLKISISSFLLSSTYFLRYIYFKVGQLY